jgi:hypothetical protein
LCKYEQTSYPATAQTRHAHHVSVGVRVDDLVADSYHTQNVRRTTVHTREHCRLVCGVVYSVLLLRVREYTHTRPRWLAVAKRCARTGGGGSGVYIGGIHYVGRPHHGRRQRSGSHARTGVCRTWICARIVRCEHKGTQP